MAPVLSQEDQQSKAWWSLSKSPSTKDLRQAYSQGKQPTSHTKSSGKFNSLATAIGLKSKKNFPSLAIQDPPTPVIADISRLDAHTTFNTPPIPVKKQPTGKLVRSRANSTAPQTPVELENERRNSLLTLSDADPFAGRPMVAPPMPHIPLDPNRLSAYSSPSVTSIAPKGTEPPSNFNRTSYASSSSYSNSNSNSHAMDSSAASSTSSPTWAPENRQLNAKRSFPSLRTKKPDGITRQASLTPTSPATPKSGGTSPIHAASPLSSQLGATASLRPKMRARGMTDSGTTHRPAFFPNDPPGPRRQLSHKVSSDFHVTSSDTLGYDEASSLKSPKVVIRKPSVPHMHPAPTAPPTQRLPPPPIPRTEDLSSSQISASSSGTSFASSFAGNLIQSVHQDSLNGFGNVRESDLDSVTSFAQATGSKSSQTLKKSISHNSLKTRYAHTSSPSSNIKFPEDISTDKATRKPRIFPHPRLPIPPIPRSIRPSTSPGLTSFPSTSETGQSPVSNKRASQGSTNRKRLFSNSSRVSTLHNSPISREDDTQSVFSLRSDVDAHLSHFKPWLTTPKSNPAPSFWDEERSDHIPNSPIFPSQDFAPQSIISPADVEKLEATVENYLPERPPGRPRGFSILSASTVFSDFSMREDVDSLAPVTLSPPPLSRPSSKQISVHESPMRRGGHSRPGSPTLSTFFNDSNIPAALPVEPFSSGSSRNPVMRPPPAPDPGVTSLPPPPRRGRKATLVSHPDIPEMAVAPPIATTLPLTIHKSSSIRSNSKAIVDKPHPSRQTLLRKPSFLDIDDEPDSENDRTDSFLDLARESFDTTR